MASIMSYRVFLETNVRLSSEKLSRSPYLRAGNLNFDRMAAKLGILNRSLTAQVYGVDVMRIDKEKDIWP